MGNGKEVLTAAFWDGLSNIYKEQICGTDWEKERPKIEGIIKLISKDLGPDYEVQRPLGVGGVGVVVQILNTNLNVPRALKFPRPKREREDYFAKVLKTEISNLVETFHPNVIEIYSQSEVEFEGRGVPFYVMEFIEGGVDANYYFKQNPRTIEVLINVLSQIIEGIFHLHRLGFIHCDVKLENILVSAEGRAVVSDLGSARHLTKGPDTVDVIYDYNYAHPGLKDLPYAATTSDDRRQKKEKVKRSDLKIAFDLFALGRNVERLLKFKINNITPYEYKYLKLMACRLLDGKNDADDCVIGLPKWAFEELKYLGMKEVRTDLNKLIGEHDLHKIIPEFDRHYIKTIQTSSLSPTPFTSRLADIISHPVFRRLAGISQLGFINLVFPTGTHTRFVHSLGVFSNAVRYCDALYNDPVNPLFRQIMYEGDLKTAFLAALCHDVGQYPLAHDFEEADPDLFSHLRITEALLKGNGAVMEADTLRGIIRNSSKWGIEPGNVLRIIMAKKDDYSFSIKERILHSIIDGPIDADKLDYLVRDSLVLGIPYGNAIDFDRLLKCLTVIFREDDEQNEKLYATLGIHEKGKTPAEAFAFTRYALFSSVYWHHTTRAAKAMLHRAVWESLLLKIKNPEDREIYLKELVDYLLQPLGAKSEQERLFEPGTIAESTQLSPGDFGIINWLYDRTSQGGRRLLAEIIDRKLYKRLLVISKKREGRAQLWDKIIDYYKTKGTDYREIVKVQDRLQSRILDELLQKPAPNSARDAESSTNSGKINDLIGDLVSEGNIIILLDVPGHNRFRGPEVLEYLPEEERTEALGGWENPVRVEDSKLWMALHDSFLESAGKIRLFCHPGIKGLLLTSLGTSRLATIVRDVFREFP